MSNNMTGGGGGHKMTLRKFLYQERTPLSMVLAVFVLTITIAVLAESRFPQLAGVIAVLATVAILLAVTVAAFDPSEVLALLKKKLRKK